MFEAELQAYGYAAIFLLAALEGEAALVGAAWLAHRGQIPFAAGVAAAFAGSWLTGEALFLLARRGGGNWFSRRAAANPRTARVTEWVRGRSRLLVFLSRFLWGFRPWIPPACAFSGMSAASFTLWNFAGSVFWIAVFAPISWYFGRTLNALLNNEAARQDLIETVVAAAALIGIGWWARRRLSRPNGAR
jgi:membrane protein DedA with SNARE-associated domain